MFNKKIPFYFHIESLIRQKILTGQLQSGERLPPERDLAAQFGVSQITVRTALANLEAESLITRMRGKGTFVTQNVPLSKQVIVTGDGHRSEFNPHSRALTLAVMKRVREQGLPLSVNDCSMQSKLRQLRGRRRGLAPLVKASSERLVGGQVYESYCVYRDEEVHFFHPTAAREMRQRYPDCQFVRLVRTAPLSLNDRGRWIAFEKL